MEDKNFKDKIFTVGQKTTKSVKISPLKNLGYIVSYVLVGSYLQQLLWQLFFFTNKSNYILVYSVMQIGVRI